MSAKSMNGYQGLPIPVGTVFPYAGSASPALFPEGYLLCNGASVLRATYPELFRVLGTTYGSVSGTTFNLPQFNNRYLKSSAVAGTVTAQSGSGSFADFTLTTANLPAIPNITFSCSVNGGYPEGSSASNTNPTQSGGAFPDSYPMSDWSVTQTVNFYANDPPVFNYTNGTGIVVPVSPQGDPLSSFDVETLQITYIIKSDYIIFADYAGTMDI
jgi:microcystin-dependent protein